MRALNHPIYRLRERGASHLPFVITLLLLLVFVWMWFQEKDRGDRAVQDQAALVQAKLKSEQKAGEIIKYAESLSNLVGYTTHTLEGIADLDATRRAAVSVTNLDTLRSHVARPTTAPADGAAGGTLTALDNAAQIAFTRSGRVHKQTIGAEKPLDFAVFGQEFKDKLQAFNNDFAGGIGTRPTIPSDSDNVEGMREYEDALKTWEARAAEYDSRMRDLTTHDAWKSYSEVLKLPAEWNDATSTAVVIDYLPVPEGGTQNVESLLSLLVPMVTTFKTEISALQAEAVSNINTLTGEKQALQASLDQSAAELGRLQGESTRQIESLSGTVTQQTESITRLQQEVSDANNKLERDRDDFRAREAKVSAERDAFREGLNNAKERRDLRIRRDEPKGTVLAISQALGTGTVDIGSKDRSYVGLVAVVSAFDNAGNRVDKGRIVVTEVLSRSASKFRILEQSAPIAGGDRIHNPLFNPTDPIHVVIHGRLDKWPRELALERLGRLGVVVQNAPTGMTDYIIIPNSMAAAPAAAAEGEEEEGGDEESAGPDPMVELEKLARRFGAQIVPERLLDSFLDY